MTTDASASSMTAVVTAPEAAFEESQGAEVHAAVSEAAGPVEQGSEGTPMEQHCSNEPSDTGQRAAESEHGQEGIGRAAKRHRADELVTKTKGCEGSAADADAGTVHIGEQSRTYNVRVKLFQEASNKIAVSASIASTEPAEVALHFTQTLKAVQLDVAHILS